MRRLRRLLGLPERIRDYSDVRLVLAYADATKRAGHDEAEMLLEGIRRDNAKRRDDEPGYVVHVLDGANARERWLTWQARAETLWAEAKRRGLHA